jgi:hypothetical protein
MTMNDKDFEACGGGLIRETRNFLWVKVKNMKGSERCIVFPVAIWFEHENA